MTVSPDHLDALLSRHIDGSLDAHETAQLHNLLERDPAALDRYIDLMTIDADTRFSLGAVRSTRPEVSDQRSEVRNQTSPVASTSHIAHRTSHIPLFALAATLLAACGLAAYFVVFSAVPSDIEHHPSHIEHPPLATLIHNTGGGNLTVPAGYPSEGSDYSSGEYALSFGTAEFMLTSAVNVRLHGGSNLFMRNDMNVALTRGSASFVVPQDATGFTVHLPDKSRIVDLGTAFSVRIDDRESTSVRVTDGAVRLDLTLPDGAAMSTLAVAGDLAFVFSDPDGHPAVSFASAEDTVAIGPGADVPDATNHDDPGGDRLNVDRRSIRLPAGTYHITDWHLAVADHTQGDDGTITPMLLTGNPDAPGSYTTVWVGDAFDPTDDGVQTVAAHGRFTLTQPTDVYAGFFTSRNGSAIIAHSMSGSTDHSTAFHRPSEPGQAVERFARHGLNRTYAFAIRVIADAAARTEQDESRASADRPLVNSPIDTPSESETVDR